jgi:hypothetical protein
MPRGWPIFFTGHAAVAPGFLGLQLPVFFATWFNTPICLRKYVRVKKALTVDIPTWALRKSQRGLFVSRPWGCRALVDGWADGLL